jgi:Asp-tRNA(Asn)/Glu-tRNA(Gln) amidotransferase A subunit family amidase
MSNLIRTVVAGALFVVVAACTDSSGSAKGHSAGPSKTPSEAVTDAVAASEPAPFPLDATIPELQRAMRTGRITAVELVDFSLARIAAYDDAGPALNALISINPRARAEAAALDAERAESGPRGPMHGIPVVVKDNIDTAEMPTTAGNLVLKDFRPSRDAFQVRKLRKAGAIILAKTNLPEFASSWETWSPVGGQTLNPYDTSRSPGGSSGGTAVAVTANFAVAGLGTDTCGSNRLPAGLNDVYSLRPTRGLSSRAGVVPYSSTADEVGPMARSVRDLAIVLEATAGADPADPTTVPRTTSFVEAVDEDGLKGRRIGVLDLSQFGDPLDYRRDLDGRWQQALDELEANGVELVDVTLAGHHGHDAMGELIAEFPFALANYLAAEPTAPRRAFARIVAALDPGTATLGPGEDAIKPGDTKPLTKAYQHALDERASLRHDIETLMDDRNLDALAYPISATTALPLGDSEGAGHSDCAAAAVAGLPAMAVPAGFTSDGLPVGLELLGRAFDEATLISIAAGYEAHTDHRRLPPTTPPLDIAP